MAVRSCWILAGIGTRCCTHQSRASQTCSIGGMSSEYAGHGRTGTFSASTNLVYRSLQHGAMHYHAKTWGRRQMNGTTMGLRISSRYLFAFKLPLIKCKKVSVVRSLCLCPHQTPPPPWGTLFTTFSKPLAHTTPYTLSAIWPVQLKPGFIREEQNSPACQWPSTESICPLKSVTPLHCFQVKTLVRTMSTQMSFPETVYDSFYQKFFGCANPQFHQLSRWLVSDDSTGEEAGCGGPGLVWLHMVCGCEADWRWLMVENWTINSLATALVDISAVSMPIACSLKM